MDKTKTLQKLLNGTASEEEIDLLRQGLTSGEISIGGNVNDSVLIVGSGNNVQVVQMTAETLDKLNARPMLGNLDRNLTGEEIASGLRRLEKLLPNRAPVLLPQFKGAAARLRPTLKTEVKALSESARRERLEALAAINSICVEAVDVSFNGLALGEAAPDYDARSPFRGLESFRPEDSEFFFGREALTQKLVGKIKAHSFLAVLGASGSGKSSLVMAGVIPALDLDYVIFRPGTNPLGELESARGKSLIVVDQLEELFTLTRDESIRKDFIARLLDESSRAKIILTLRSDFLAEVGAYRTLSAEIQNHLEIVPPMDVDELRRAMEGQAGVTGLRFEADLSQQILDDVAGEPGAMPLLQHALWELWNRRHGRNLRASEYRAFGGVKQAITSTAEKVYADCSKPEQDSLRDIFLRLTRLDDGDEGRDTRRRVSLGDLIPSGRDAASITLLLDKLANVRLVVKTTVNDDKTEVEVAHEALIRHWERLRIWLNEDRDALHLRESVSESAKEWEKEGRHESLLNSRWVKLDEALLLAQDARYRLTEIEQAYLKRCVALRNKEQRERERRRKIALASTFAVTVTIMAILVGWSISSTKSANMNATQVSVANTAQSNAKEQAILADVAQVKAEEQAKIALARQLAAQAQLIFNENNSVQQTAVLLAVQSTKMYPSAQSSVVLHKNSLSYVKSYSSNKRDYYFADINSEDNLAISFECDKLEGQCLHNHVVIWDLIRGKIATRVPLEGVVLSASFVANTTYILIRLEDQSFKETINILDITSGEKIFSTGIDLTTTISVSPDAKYIATGDQFGIVKVWEIKSGQEILYYNSGWVYGISFSADSHYIVSGGRDNIIHLWNLHTQQEVVSFDHGDQVLCVSFSPDGKKIVSGGSDHVLRVWDISSGAEFASFMHDGDVDSVMFSPDSQFIVSGSEDSTARVWMLSTKQEVSRMSHDDFVYTVSFSPDGKHVVSGGIDGTARVWDVNTGQEVSRMTHDQSVYYAKFTFDGKQVVSYGDDGARLWNIFAIEQQAFSPEYGRLFYISVNGEYAITLDSDHFLYLWNVQNQMQIDKIDVSDFETIYSVALSPDMKYLAIGGFDYTFRVWDLTNKRGETYTIKHHPNSAVYALDFSPDSKFLSIGSQDGTARVVDVSNGRTSSMFEGESRVDSIAFSPDGKYLASGFWGKIVVWDVSTEKMIAEFNQEDLIESVVFSPNGKLLATGSADDTARIWNIETKQEISRLKYQNYVWDIAFSPDSNFVISGSRDNTASIWNVLTGQEVARWITNYDVEHVRFSSDGKYVFIGSGNSIYKWLWIPEDLIIDACSRVTRNLTRAEWDQYIGDALPYQAVCPNLPIEP